MAHDPGTEGPPDEQDRPKAEPPVDSRPRPAYGEYAPEGWEWKPETDEGAESARPTAHSAQSPPAPAAHHPAHSFGQSSAAPASGRLPGVPHNLGVRDGSTQVTPPVAAPPSTGTTSGSSTSRGSGEPYRASAPPASNSPDSPQSSGSAPQSTTQQSGSQQAGSQHGPQQSASQQHIPAAHVAASPTGPPTGKAQPKSRKADRIITIILLVIGAFGALSLADSLFRVEAQFIMMASMFGVDTPTLPGWVNTMCLIGAVGVLLLYALTLIYSVQRMRARKLCFWVPLAAGALAWIAVSVLTGIAITTSPELMSAISDPNAMNEMLQYLSENPQP